MPYSMKQYDSCKAFLQGYSDSGNVLEPQDSLRVRSYFLYDDFYGNRPETFAVTMRGDSDTEIYLPSSKKIIDSTARFLGVNFNYTTKGGDSNAINDALQKLFKREALRRKFIQGKKSLLTRGDWLLHIVADPSKDVGERISINSIHPACYFRIEDPNDQNRLLGVHLVDLIHDPRDKTNDFNLRVARRQTYRKRPEGITNEVMLFELGGWDDRYLAPKDLRPVSIILKETILPPQIKQIPVYHIPNNEPDGSSWGMSQISGIEYIINALNQSITYEDLTLVLQGLGVYASTAAPPIDPRTGKPGQYKFGPGDVVEISPGDTFARVTGVSSVSPYQDHLNYLDNYALQGLGIPDMATGIVDVAVAQSGIALALKMGPIIAENADKEETIKDVWNNFWYDLNTMWFPAFEELDSPGTVIETVFGDPMPVNRDSLVQELIALKAANLITTDEARHKMEEIGYEYDANVLSKIMDEMQQTTNAQMGPYPGELGAGANPQNLMDLLGSNVSSGVNGNG